MTQTSKSTRLKRLIGKIRKDNSGLAAVEFAVSLPFFLGLTVGGFEMANYATVVMKLNQITIHTADSAARMGEDTILAQKRISELHINDVFAGTIREGESLLLGGQHAYTDPSTQQVTLRGNARIILSSVEPVASFNPSNPRYRIRWQRCVGSANFYHSSYGTVSDSTSITGIGPAGKKIAPPDNGAVMFVETQYYFQPAILNGFSKLTDRTVSKHAAMIVRDDRDYTQIYNTENVQISTCM